MKLLYRKIGLIFSAIGILMLLGFGLLIAYVRSTESRADRVYSYPRFSESVVALRKNPNDPAALRGMANHYALKSEYLKAIPYLRQAVSVEPTNTFDKFLLGIALDEAGQREEAIRVLSEVAATEGDNPERKAADKLAQKMKNSPNGDTPAPRATLQIAPHHYGTQSWCAASIA